jgi:hypothetical protein
MVFYVKEEKKMTKEEIVSKNIGLAFDFVDYLIKSPSEIERLPDSFEIKGELENLAPKELVNELLTKEKELVYK